MRFDFSPRCASARAILSDSVTGDTVLAEYGYNYALRTATFHELLPQFTFIRILNCTLIYVLDNYVSKRIVFH